MPLILAIEPERRQAAQLTAVVRKRLGAELILVSTTERALDAIGNRVPDLVLVPALLSPQDDAALAAALRVIATAANVQMLTIPVLGSPSPESKTGGVLSALRRARKSTEPEGCDPDVFAEQIASYLEHAAQERSHAADRAAFAEEVADAPTVDASAAQKAEAVDVALATAADRPGGPAAPIEPSPAAEMPRDEAPAAHAGDPVAPLEEDDGVSFALEEVTRALFADPPSGAGEAAFEALSSSLAALSAESGTKADSSDPLADLVLAQDVSAPVDPEPTLATRAPSEAETDGVAALPGSDVGRDDPAVEELIAALQALPLSAIEADNEDDWTPPAEQPDSVLEEMRGLLAEPDETEVDLTADLRAPDAVDPMLEPDVFDLDAGELVQAPARSTAALAPEPAPVQTPAAAEPSHIGGKSEKEWVALIESLRLDVERLRHERAEKPGAKSRDSREAKPARPAAAKKPKPVQDEWGLYDPEQCGFAALLAKLEEVTEPEDERF